MNVKRLVKDEVAALRAYQAKEIPCRIKLDANESPYGFQDILKAAGKVKTNRYPDPEAKRLKMALARGLGVRPENLLQGNGSDELIYYLITAFGGPILYPVPTFSMYGIISQALGEERKEVPLDKDFDLDMRSMTAAIKREHPKLIFLSSPNNPTGNCFSSEKIFKILDASKGIVVVDEAYQPFSSEKGFMPMLKDYKNLVIMRTLSKIGLAALRLGFLIAHEEILDEVNKVRLPFNVNSLSQEVAIAALKKKHLLMKAIRQISAERDRMIRAMELVKGVDPFPSEANFILFRVSDPAKVYNRLLKKGILVRNISDAMEGCLRVTVGLPRENDLFLISLRKAI